jgi:hypothetical protein
LRVRNTPHRIKTKGFYPFDQCNHLSCTIFAFTFPL